MSALLENYQRDSPEVHVAFFGGPPPDDTLLDAIAGTPFVVRVRPDSLSRADADRLLQSGCVGIELDALTFDAEALKGVGRRYSPSLVTEQCTVLRGRGVEVGIVLAPGLPGTTFQTCLDDARLAAGLVDTARIHPVIVLDRSGLRTAHGDGRYEALGLADAITVCRAMVDVLEQRQIRVIRIGQQPGPDGLGRWVAGPRHSSLRELVESRRTLDAVTALVEGLPSGSVVAIYCAPEDESRVRGPKNQHVRQLRADHRLDSVEVRPDPALQRGHFTVEVA